MYRIFYIVISIILFSNLNFASFAIGCCKGNISILRFWNLIDGKLKEKMLIFNNDSLSANVEITVSRIVAKSIYHKINDILSFGTIGGPWEIPAYKYIIVDEPYFNVKDSSKYYFKISKITKDTSLVCGYITPYNAKPNFVNDSSAYYVTQKIDGIENRDSFLWWEYKSIFLQSGQKTIIKLNITDNVLKDCTLKKILTFKWPDSLSQNNIFPLNINADGFEKHYIFSSDTLNYWNRSLEYILSYSVSSSESEYSKSKHYNLEFVIVAPMVKKITDMSVSVFVDEGTCRKEFDLPIIITP